MAGDETMERVRSNAVLFRRWFGYWRRRYMWLRLAILLVVFAPTLYEMKRPLIRELVVYAVTAIDTARFPTPFYKARLFRGQQVKVLERSLIARFDADGDGRLDAAESQRLTQATGLSARDATASVLHADYDRLLAAARKLDLPTRFSTSREMRTWAYRTAQAEEAQWHDQQWAEVERELRMPRPRATDYLHWSTWARGMGWFLGRTGGLLDTVLPPIFAGVSHSWAYYGYGDQPPLWRSWRGYIGWAIVFALVAISMRNFGKRRELERRFRADPVLAAAPCPICGRPTHDFGALRELRVARSTGVGVVVGLAAFGAMACLMPHASPRMALAVRLLPVMLGLTAAFIRWDLWPELVHADHTRPRLRLIATAAYALAVLVPLGAIIAAWVAAFG
jgi:hypothetical protein